MMILNARMATAFKVGTYAAFGKCSGLLCNYSVFGDVFMDKKLLPFRKLNLGDRAWVLEKFKESNFQGCEYSFGNNFIWRNSYNLEVLDYKGFCLLLSTYNGATAYSYPAGNGNVDVKEAIEALMADASARNAPFILRGVSQEKLDELMIIFPDLFDYEIDRGESDYIYLTERLTTLSGKKLQSKRNHIARFKDNPNWAYEPITRDNIDECIAFNLKWCEENGCEDDPELQLEYCAVVQSFKHFFELEFTGGLLRRDGEVIAFTMGEPLNSDTFVVHIEKAFHHIQGTYPMINQQFIINNCQNYKYVNREEDVGDEGLRKSKLSYYPDILLNKYRLKLKERVCNDNLCENRDDCRSEGDLERIVCRS